MTTNTLTTTAPQRAHEAAPAHLSAPPAPRPSAPALARPASQPATPTAGLRVPRPVRATTHAGGVPYELLLAPADGTPSALDVDPRLLVVQRRSAAAASVPPRRTLAPPSDERREAWERQRRMLVTAAASFGGAVVAGLSVVTALA